jgi:hypothetical protein
MSTVLDKARQAKERTAQVASGVKDGLAEKVGDARELLATGAADLLSAGASRVREVIAELNSTLPSVREAGYELTDVSVNIGVSPTVVASFHATDAFTEEHAQKVLDANADHKLTVFLLRALLQARKLQTSIDLGGLKPCTIALQIGLPPVVSLKFA